MILKLNQGLMTVSIMKAIFKKDDSYCLRYNEVNYLKIKMLEFPNTNH